MLRTLLSVALLLACLGAPLPAGALSCVEASAIIANLDGVAYGEITGITGSTVELQVSRHYKGSGPEVLHVEVAGSTTNRMDMNIEPKVGHHLLIGYVNENGRLFNDVCEFFWVQETADGELPAELTAALGAGIPTPPAPDSAPAAPTTAPAPEAAPADAPPDDYVPYGLVIGVVLIAGAVLWTRSRNRL